MQSVRKGEDEAMSSATDFVAFAAIAVTLLAGAVMASGHTAQQETP